MYIIGHMAGTKHERLTSPGFPGIEVRKPHKSRVALGLAATATLAAVGGGCVFPIFGEREKSSPTPMPSGTVEPTPIFTPSNTPEITIIPTPTASPTPEATPTLDMTKWYNQIPESPYKSVNDVPLYKDSNGFSSEGDMQMLASFKYKPYFTLAASGLTLLFATPDITHNEIVLEVTTGVDTIKQKSCSSQYDPGKGISINACDLTGGNFKVIVKQGIAILGGTHLLGTNLTDVAKSLMPGALVSCNIIFGESPTTDSAGITLNELNANLNNWNKYRTEVGQTAAPRTASNLLTFIPWNISVYPPNS
jgi:hypothetical protein